MIRRALPFLALLLVGCPPSAPPPPPPPPPIPTNWSTEPHPEGTAPRIDIVFCLDSTGSMQKVITTAKDKIREIAHWIENGQPKPTVRFAVVCYRDKHETYVTKTYPFTPDVAKIEAALGEIVAEGGGDVPEHVVAGLKVAVQDVKWDATAKLKLVFLLGDAPPHLDYDAESNVDPVLEAAKQQDIAIGAFVCGDGMNQTGKDFWKKVSDATGGSFETIGSADVLSLESVIFAAIGERAKAQGITYSY